VNPPATLKDQAAARRVGALVLYLVDQMERAAAAALVHQEEDRRAAREALRRALPGLEFQPIEVPARAALQAAYARVNFPELTAPDVASEEELSEAMYRAASIYWSLVLAPGEVAGAQVVTLTIDAAAEARFAAIHRAWLLPILTLALGATAGELGTLAAPEGAVFTPTFAGWMGVDLAAPVGGALGAPMGATPADSAKSILVSALFGLGQGRIAAAYLALKFLGGLMAPKGGR